MSIIHSLIARRRRAERLLYAGLLTLLAWMMLALPWFEATRLANLLGQDSGLAPAALAAPLPEALQNSTGLAAGGYHTCALTSSGGIKCWGANSNGQLGDGTITQRLTPTDVSGLTSGVIALVAGAYHTCALTTGGGAKCWGGNWDGQLGDNTTTQRLVPTDVNGLTSGVIALVAGAYHTCALTTGGGAKCWGNNSDGQLGDNTTTQRLVPTNVSGLTSGVIALTAGAYHTCALISGGGARCWGAGWDGQLGDGTTAARLIPTNVSGLTSGVSALAAGSYHTCALASGGAKCWGYNSDGQLGDNTTTQRLVPTNVNGLTSGVSALTAGAYHTCALASGGAKCWGANSDGQLGDGTTAERLTATDVSTLASGVSALVAGAYHTCALITGGSVKCWGYNWNGQLGNGETSRYSLTPIPVATFSNGPIAVGDSATTPEDTPVTITVLANDTDPENNINPATVTVPVNPLHGSVGINSTNGEITYTPVANYFTPSGQPDTFVYQVCDTTASCGSASVTIEVTAVNDPPTTNLDSTPANPSGTSVSFVFSGSDVEDTTVTFACILDNAGFTPCTSPQNYANLAAGTHVFQVRAVDSVGATALSPASYTWAVNIPPPDTTIATTPAALSNSSTAAFTFTSPDSGATFQCSLDSAAFSACTSPHNLSGLGNGSHTFRVAAVNSAGADPTPAQYTWTVDTTAPDTTINSGPTGTTTSISAQFTFSANETATFQCSLDSAAFSACTSPQSYTGLANGAHTFSVRAVDGVGNVDASPATRTWTVNGPTPETQITSGPANPTTSTSASFSFSGSNGAVSFQCSLDNATFSACTSPKAYTGLAVGSHNFRVRSVNNVNTVDPTPASATWVINATPATITIVKDSVPDNNQNVSFTGNLGNFTLDDANPNDGDANPKQRSFSVAPGSYSVVETVPSSWHLMAITCSPAANAQVNLSAKNVVITVASGNSVTCTFRNERSAQVTARKFNDLNGNRARASNEPYLAGWAMTLYNAQGATVTSATTNSQGTVNFTNLPPGTYTVCELQRSGWSSTLPGAINPTYGQPCISLTLASNQSGSVLFGNRQGTAAASVPVTVDAGVEITDLPNVNIEETSDDDSSAEVGTDEEEERAPDQDKRVFLPLVIR